MCVYIYTHTYMRYTYVLVYAHMKMQEFGGGQGTNRKKIFPV